jgi:hypothetical protein
VDKKAILAEKIVIAGTGFASNEFLTMTALLPKITLVERSLPL